jgi:diguanylate cyclase (GGDEF)-like protein
MSFRNRLTMFFVVIVVIPMIAIAVVLLRLISESRGGRADAALSSLSHSAAVIYGDAAGDPATAALADRISVDPQLSAALQAGDRAQAQKRIAELQVADGLQRLAIARGGTLYADSGSSTAIAVVQRDLLGSANTQLGRLQLSTLAGSQYASQVHSLTGLGVVVRTTGMPLSTLPAARAPETGASPRQVTVAGREYSAVSFQAPGFGTGRTSVGLFYDETSLEAAAHRDERLAAILIAALSGLALLLAISISRSLQDEIAGLLAAARRVAGGDLGARVPVHGDDEFAQLGREFNKMSGELQARVDELGEQRRLLEGTLRRVGETFASSLDRDALLEIVLRTVVDGVSAESGRAFVVEAGGRGQLPVASIGAGPEVRALAEVEAATRSSGRPEQIQRDGISALGHPLWPSGGGRPAGVISVSRADRPFDDAEQEMFAYLAEQAAISIGNVDLHERIKEQAITDDLTGLFNRRHFEAVLSDELRRVQRFGHSVALAMIDIDDFKKINDAHGHMQGDAVLAEVARVVRACVRDIDCAARYGGEELSVVLAETDVDGATRLAERVRSAIAALRVPRVSGQGDPVTVTVSIGIAAAPEAGTSAGQLINAADDALYRAKRAGKNRSVGA